MMLLNELLDTERKYVSDLAQLATVFLLAR